jgi:hypothetical protein
MNSTTYAVEAARRQRYLDQIQAEAAEMLDQGKTVDAALHHVATDLWGHRSAGRFPELADDYRRAMAVAEQLVQQVQRERTCWRRLVRRDR